MPTDYELWVTQHGLPDAQQVQVLEFKHEAWGSLWVTDYGTPFSGTTEEPVDFTAEPVAFTLDLPKSGSTTQQELIVRMDALGGYVINQIRQMTDADRESPIELIWRAYLDSDHSAPAIDSLSFELLDISATRLAVEMRCAGTVFPNVQVGIRYTIDRFPTLAY